MPLAPMPARSPSPSVASEDTMPSAILRSMESEELDLTTMTSFISPASPLLGPLPDSVVVRRSPSQPHTQDGLNGPRQVQRRAAVDAARASAAVANNSLAYRSCTELASLLGSSESPSLLLEPPAADSNKATRCARFQETRTLALSHTPPTGSISREFRSPQSLASSVLSVRVDEAETSPTASPTVVPFFSFAERPVVPVSLSADHATLSTQQRQCRTCKSHEVVELTDLSLYIPQGSFHGVLSTCARTARAALQLLAGTRTPTTGTVLSNEVPTFTLLYRRRAAWISDVSGITESLTVRDNLRFAYRMRVADTKDGESRIIGRVASALGLEKLLDCSAGSLGRAHAYLLCVGLELVLEPAVLLLDNPLVHFTPPEVTSLFLVAVEGLLGEALGQPMTVILSTTDITWPLYRSLDGLTVLSSGTGETIFSGGILQLEPFLHGDGEIPNVAGESIADLLAQMEDTHSTAQMAARYRHSEVYKDMLARVHAHGQRAAQVGHAPAALVSGNDGGAATARATSTARAPADTTVVLVVEATPLPPAATARSVSERDDWGADDAPLWMRSTPSYGAQFGLLLVYMVRKNVLLSLWYLGPWMCLFVVFVTLSAIVIRLGLANVEDGVFADGSVSVQNFCGVIFMILASACQTGLVSIDVEIQERLALRHFERNHYLRPGQYLLATLLRQLLISFVLACVGLLSALLVGLPVWPLSVLMGLLFLVQSALLLALVYVCGGRQRFVVYIQGTYYLYSTLFSGYLVNGHAVPMAVQAFSMLRYAYGGVLAASVDETCKRVPTDDGVCAYANMVLVNNRFDESSPVTAALLLFGLGVGFFALAALMMQITIARVTRDG